eukprot:m51a1_g4414 hypothetical protein (771) ;mRNA; r:8-2637
MQHTTSLAVLCALVLALAAAAGGSACASNSYDVHRDNATGHGVVVVGQSAPFTGPHNHSGLDVRAGIEAAFAAANETSLLRFVLSSLDDAYDNTRQRQNTQALLCTGANGLGPAFAITGNVGSSASEAALAVVLASQGSDGVPVPYVGGLTSSEVLRTQANVLQNSSSASDGAPRTGVALVRAGGGPELSAILSFLSNDWDVLNHTSVFYQDTSFARYAVSYLRAAIGSLGGSLLSTYGHATVTVSSELSSVAVAGADALLAGGAEPRAIVLIALGTMSGALMQELARRGKSGIQYVAMAWITADELYAGAPASAWATLSGELGSSVYFSQLVPMPTTQSSPYRIVREYQAAMKKYRPEMPLSHASLEGFVGGSLITAAAQRALELNGWPLTRANFLDAVFRDVRTFSLYGYTLGPYGDGIGNSDAEQTSDDWCNQGSHQVFMTSMNMSTGELSDVASSTFKFSGCSVYGWNDTSHRAVLGFAFDEATTDTSLVKLGLAAAVGSSNSENDRMMTLTTINADVGTAAAKLEARQAVAIAGLSEDSVDQSLDLIKAGEFLPLLSPRSGLQSLRKPFQRGIVNLFASYYQEARTMAMFLIQKEGAHTITVLFNSETHSEAGNDLFKGLTLCKDRNLLGVNASGITLHSVPFVNTSDEEVAQFTEKATVGHSFIVVGSPLDAWELVQTVGNHCTSCPVMLESSISEDDFWALIFWSDATWSHVYRASLTPPLWTFSSSHPLRKDFDSWVSQVDQMQAVFDGFFIGKSTSASTTR